MANEHDSRYKKLFSHPSSVKKLMLSFIDEPWVKELDYSSLEKLDKSFVTDEFINKESDIIYRIKFREQDIFIYLLIEFQSSVDRFMSLRMLRYITEFYEYIVSAKKVKKLPAVFPVMLYNGEKRWTASEQLGNLIERTIPDKYIPEFSFYKIAENEFSNNLLAGIRNIISAVFYLENSRIENLEDEIDQIVLMISEEKPEEIRLFRLWIKNYFNGEDTDATDKIAGRIREIEEVKDMLSSSLKKRDKMQFKLGLEKGIEKGLEKGIEKSKAEIARNMILKGIDADTVAEITGLSMGEILKLQKGK